MALKGYKADGRFVVVDCTVLDSKPWDDNGSMKLLGKLDASVCKVQMLLRKINKRLDEDLKR